MLKVIEVRSKNFAFGKGKAALISSNMGLEHDFYETLVGVTETLKILATLATSAALLRNVTASIGLVPNAICD
jgi:hypothetical protein